LSVCIFPGQCNASRRLQFEQISDYKCASEESKSWGTHFHASRLRQNTMQTASLHIIFIARFFCFYVFVLSSILSFCSCRNWNPSYQLIYADDNSQGRRMKRGVVKHSRDPQKSAAALHFRCTEQTDRCFLRCTNILLSLFNDVFSNTSVIYYLSFLIVEHLLGHVANIRKCFEKDICTFGTVISP
jgi:hypothetical protein